MVTRKGSWPAWGGGGGGGGDDSPCRRGGGAHSGGLVSLGLTPRPKGGLVGGRVGRGQPQAGPGRPRRGSDAAGRGAESRRLPPSQGAGGRGAEPNSGRHDVTRACQPMRPALARILRKVSACQSTLFSYI